jgi:V/A-type H+-transporting ATPase subunit B
VIGKVTREDHPQVMNAAIRLYADAANSKTKLENGFELSDYDRRVLKFAEDYSRNILAIDVNLETDEMLDETWKLFSKYMTQDEVGIKQIFIDKHWKEKQTA